MQVTLTSSQSNISDFSHNFLGNETIHIGRNPSSNWHIDENYISSNHAVLVCKQGALYIKDMGSSNGSKINDVLLSPNIEYPINNGDDVAFASLKFKVSTVASKPKGIAVKPRSNNPIKVKRKNNLASGATVPVQPRKSPQTSNTPTQDFLHPLSQYLQGNKQKIVIGRDSRADVQLPQTDQMISRVHAEVFRKDGTIYVKDLSTNGTFINGRRIPKKLRQKLKPEDTLYIGLYAFRLNEKTRDLNQELAVEGKGISKIYNADVATGEPVGLQTMNINIGKGEFIALMGPSGCGKSTLMKTLIGEQKASSGRIHLHGLDLYENYNLLKRYIGYVPQEDIVHRELSVQDSLYYAAKLRMGDGVTEQVIQSKITEVLESLKINTPELRQKQIKDLSGGQRKRVSIAVELLNSPTILFLDEPTSPLDPETIDEFLKCVQSLAHKGTTIVMVTHKPDDINYADKVLFLTTKGYQAFYGRKEDVLNYFQAQNYIDIYSKLSQAANVKAIYRRWQNTENQSLTISQQQAVPAKGIHPKTESPLLQFWWLSKRYMHIKINDTGNMILLLMQPLIIAALLSFIFDKGIQVGALFLMAIAAIWFGVSNAAKEIVGEIPIYRRERMYNMSIYTYLFSKIVVLSIIAFVQIFVFVVIVYLTFHQKNSEDPQIIFFWQTIAVMFLLAVTATLLGLLLSALFSNTEKVMTIVPIALMPQIMLAGVLTKLDSLFKELCSYATLGRWGTEMLCHLQDSHEGFKHTQEVFVHSSPPSDFEQVGQDTVVHSVYSQIPIVSDSLFIADDSDKYKPIALNETESIKDSALDIVGFYTSNNENLWKVCEESGITGNVYAVLILGFIFFLFTFLSLKNKDTI